LYVEVQVEFLDCLLEFSVGFQDGMCLLCSRGIDWCCSRVDWQVEGKASELEVFGCFHHECSVSVGSAATHGVYQFEVVAHLILVLFDVWCFEMAVFW